MTEAPSTPELGNPELNGLVKLSDRKGVDIRPTLLRVVTDLYLQKPTHTEEESQRYERLALKLIEHVDVKTRSTIAQKIAGYPNAPAAVRQRLLKEYIKVQAPEPEEAPAASAAEPAPVEPAPVEATPVEASAVETTPLEAAPAAALVAETSAVEVAPAETAPATAAAAEIVPAETAPIAPATTEPVSAAQPENTPAASAGKAAADELSELFFEANAEERRLILLNLPYAPITPAEPVEPAAAQSSIKQLEAAALNHRIETFARELERVLSISRPLAQRMVVDPSGEPIVVSAAALGMPSAVLQRILLCINPVISQSVQRVYDLTLLHEELDAASALQMIAIWQKVRHSEEMPAAAPPAPAPAPRESQATIAERRAAFSVVRPKIRWDEHAQVRKIESA